MKLLCLSNGHGEDAIAVRILDALRQHPDAPELAALPLVGAGRAYLQADIPIIGPVKAMPSGGFIYMDGRQLWQDVRGGLLGLTWAQLQTVKRWGNSGGTVLAVGDIVPLAMAWWSGGNYGFVGTAKSEYYIRDDGGRLLKQRRSEAWSGSVYLPWERWLLSRSRCRAVYPRDSLTTTVLKQFQIPAHDLGNPMMDGLAVPRYDRPENEDQRPLTVLLLTGSRSPEAERNWQILLAAAQALCRDRPQRPLLFLGAIAPGLDPAPFQAALSDQGWRSTPLPDTAPITAPDAQAWNLDRDRHQIILTQQAYAPCLNAADLAFAMAGTATEQFVGLGKPAIALPGAGPQFTPQFAEAQTRLLGVSVTLVQRPQDVPKICHSLLNNPDTLQIIAENGRNRMGTSGAAARIADHLVAVL
ncbi:lipid-A-disaccharide synthase-related protein [Spirulina sp.]|uniref:lipid-A-disaccharide synthase-related protein n=1 Tax=Spirulina sp. TaxID=1157 RepID=UPI003F6E60B4